MRRIYSLVLFVLWVSGISLLEAKDTQEKPGKTVLYPYFELSQYNFQPQHIRVHLKENELTFVNVDKTIQFALSDIHELTLVKEVPDLRGELINLFDDQQLSILSKLYLRMNVIKDNQEMDYFLTLDFAIKNDVQLGILKSDISKINELNLPTDIVIRTKKDLYNLLNEHHRVFYQYPLFQHIDDIQKKRELEKSFFKVLVKELKKSVGKTYHAENYHMGNILFSAIDESLSQEYSQNELLGTRSRLYRGARARERENRLKELKNKRNLYRVVENLKVRHLPIEMNDFRKRRLQDEFCMDYEYTAHKYCAGRFNGALIKGVMGSQIDQRFLGLANKLEDFGLEMKRFDNFIQDRKFDYIHKGEQSKLDMYLLKLLEIDDDIVQTIELAKKNKDERFLDIKTNLLRVRLGLWSSFLAPIIKLNDYDISRFYNEGHFYKVYGSNIFKDGLEFIQTQLKDVLPFNWAVIEMSELAPFATGDVFLSSDEIKMGLNDLVATEVEKKGTDLGEGLVNGLGQVFKKRPWVPYLRVSTMFRENFMTARRDFVYSHLFAKDGMEPGDIILEKDMQANTDVLIPGYWVHASLYLGSIKDMKAMGLWDDSRMAVIRHEIELYRTSMDRQYYLNVEWGNKLEFDDIPWFYESDRPGVGVHPLHKFMRTDGMAVLRPSSGYDLDYKKQVYFRANERMYFPYDYVHNVRNKFSVSCSKVILKLFNDITFPVSEYLSYMSVSPDQIGQPVSLDPRRPLEGELKLIMFFDAEDKGNLNFHHKDESTFGFYPKYLKFTGRL